MPGGLARLDVNLQALETRLNRAADVPLSPEECETLKTVVHTFARVLDLLDEQGTTIARVRELLGRSRTEKTRQVPPQAGIDVPERPSPMRRWRNRARFPDAVATERRHIQEHSGSGSRMPRCSRAITVPCACGARCTRKRSPA